MSTAPLFAEHAAAVNGSVVTTSGTPVAAATVGWATMVGPALSGVAADHDDGGRSARMFDEDDARARPDVGPVVHVNLTVSSAAAEEHPGRQDQCNDAERGGEFAQGVRPCNHDSVLSSAGRFVAADRTNGPPCYRDSGGRAPEGYRKKAGRLLTLGASA